MSIWPTTCALPPVLSLSHGDWESPLVPLLCDEVVKDEPGQAAVLDRLLDLLLTAVLKAWFARQEADRPAWWRFQGDRIVERAEGDVRIDGQKIHLG